MTTKEKRRIVEYIAVGTGLLLTSIRCYINWKLDSVGTNEIIGNISLILLGISSVIIILLSCIRHIENKLEFKFKSHEGKIWDCRIGADPGLSLILLFPCALLFGLLSHFSRTSYIYAETTIISQGFLVSSIVILWNISSGKTVKPSLRFYIFLTIGIVILNSLILGKINSLNYIATGLLCLSTQLVYLFLWNQIISKNYGSFTIGESFTVSQAGASLITACILWFLSKFFDIYPSNFTKSYGEETTQFSYILAIGCGSLILIPTAFQFARQAIPFYIIAGALGVLVMYPSWYSIFGREPVLWMLDFVLNSGPKVYMFFHWVTCSVLALGIVAWFNFTDATVTTIVRKYFHIIVIMVYLPALVWEPDLLFLASCLAFGVFVILELIRVLYIPPFGSVLNSSLQIFLDEKDKGILILTHVYLLFGTSVSLWLLPLNFRHAGFRIATMSGILSLGFGDTAASVGGTWWGKTKWPDSKKSLEGTYSAIVVQSLVSLILLWIVEGSWYWFLLNGVHVIIATCLCCILEGVTTQVDNLALPLFLYTMLVVL